MKVVLYCLLSLSLAWLIHLVIWRVALPMRHTRTLLLIFFSVLGVTLVASLASVLPVLTWAEILQLAVFYVPTALAYICFYSAIEEDSPSVGIIALTSNKKKCQIDDYYSIVNDDLLVSSRINAMVRDRLLTESGARYQLTAKGFRLGRLFCASFHFLQLKNGG